MKLFTYIGTGVVILAVGAGVYFYDRTPEAPEPFQCDLDTYEQHVHPPADLCTTAWVTTCSDFGEWISQCVNGEVDHIGLTDHLLNLKSQCETVGCVWSLEGI